ncbi:MAG: divergent polysaccharide deacetylase family protein [Desulfovibrio sp.]|uniref:divergent polysaccharide deacetylase family protein n=1 Tax=Desulfovibrio sp. TaxID=885 RepID=UPI002A3688FF|nr:divergent polysaccharide deacetylase family protein [Desulfovibrio sp.]MDY0259923.1 divergent polysaccharide deacetylase family protein [Desulfovibrio sp.]
MLHKNDTESLQTGPLWSGGRLSASVRMALAGGLWLAASLAFALWVGRDAPAPFAENQSPAVTDAASAPLFALPGQRPQKGRDAADPQARLDALDKMVEEVLPQTLPTARWRRELASPPIGGGPDSGYGGYPGGTADPKGMAKNAQRGNSDSSGAASGAPSGASGQAAEFPAAASQAPAVRVYTVTGPCAPLRLGLGLLDKLARPDATVLAERTKLAAEEAAPGGLRGENGPNAKGGAALPHSEVALPDPDRAGPDRFGPDLANGAIRLAWTDAGSLDIYDNGRLTHRFLFPGREAQLADLAIPLPRPALALVIDDMGQSLSAAEALAALPYPVTLAIWPRAPHARATADVAAQRRLDVMAHVPMEPLARADGKRPQPGPGALRTDMDPGQIRAALTDNLSALPSAMGLNNHMGSAFTGSAASCRHLCAWLEGMGFFVLDSLTTPDSQLGVQARALGMVSAVRDVFLDTRRQTPDILSALDQAAAKARARGYAVAIGHPYEETLRALRTWQDKEQVALVPLRRLVWRLAQEKAADTARTPAR